MGCDYKSDYNFRPGVLKNKGTQHLIGDHCNKILPRGFKNLIDGSWKRLDLLNSTGKAHDTMPDTK